MTWLNEYEVAQAMGRFAEHPTLGPATLTLTNLVIWTNDNSDGWPYWQKPSRAAAKLQDLVHQARLEALRSGQEPEVTVAAIKGAYRPIKAFLTRQGVEHDSIIVEVAP